MARSIGRPMAVLVLSDEERSYLERQVRRRRVARSISDRCRMILRCADGLTNKAVAAELGVHEHTVGKWRRRFLKERIEGLSDEPRPGRPRTLTDEQVAEVIERTLETTPADATHWSIRSMARESGLSHTTIRRIWAAFSVQPHRSKTFKLSSDPLFVDKVRDIIGLYLSPPDRALVLCVDEKSQIQALDRSQPVLPMLPGMPCRRTADRLQSFKVTELAARTLDGRPYRAASSSSATDRHPGHRVRIDQWVSIDRRRPRGAGPPHRHGQLRHLFKTVSGQGLAGPAEAHGPTLHARPALPGSISVGATSPNVTRKHVAARRATSPCSARSRHPQRRIMRTTQRRSEALRTKSAATNPRRRQDTPFCHPCQIKDLCHRPDSCASGYRLRRNRNGGREGPRSRYRTA